MSYIPTTLKEKIRIKRLVTVHYFEFAKDYIFEGESHDFWEFVYVDTGEAEIVADTQTYTLKQGDMIFHKPNEFHSVWANGKIAPNLVVISFECNSRAIRFFENRILQIGDGEKNLLAQIIREARNAFISPLHTPSLKQLEKNPHSLFASEQLIKIYLELLLIRLYRRESKSEADSRLSSVAREKGEEAAVQKVIAYLEKNVTRNLTFDEICKSCKLSKTNLKVMFKEKTGTSVMEYYKSLKIEAAKRLIREGQYNFTEIAEKLGYGSIHYFSRSFKKTTDMTPSQYASSVKIKI